MTRKELINQIRVKRSFLCIGLDTDTAKIPEHLLEHDDPIHEFNRLIIEATYDLCIAYKPNIAFYEAMGSKGWDSLKKTLHSIPENLFVIADAKRGDIGNTAEKYAQAYFEELNADAVTLSPYMGKDSIEPYLKYDNKWSVILGLTSNKGADDFQQQELTGGGKLYENVIKNSASWGTKNNTMFVTGATQASHLESIREIIPNHFLLVPGVGAQGGSLSDVANAALTNECGLLVNVSRGIIYASNGTDFSAKARSVATNYQKQMERILEQAEIIEEGGY